LPRYPTGVYRQQRKTLPVGTQAAYLACHQVHTLTLPDVTGHPVEWECHPIVRESIPALKR